MRVSTSDRGQTVENQLQPLQEAAERLGWTVVAICRDEGISGAGGRDRRLGSYDPSCRLRVQRHTLLVVRVDDPTEPDGDGGTGESLQFRPWPLPPGLVKERASLFIVRADSPIF